MKTRSSWAARIRRFASGMWNIRVTPRHQPGRGARCSAAAGSASTRPARSPAAAGSRNSPAPYPAAAGYLIPDGPGGQPRPTRRGSHRTPYPYSAADGPSGHRPGGGKSPSSPPGPCPPPASPASRARAGPAARHSRFRRVLRPCRPTGPCSPERIAGHLARAAGEVIASLVRSLRGRRDGRSQISPGRHPAICRVTSATPPKPAALPPAWMDLTVTARRLYGTRYPPIWRRLGRLVFHAHAAPNRMFCGGGKSRRAMKINP